MLYNEWTSIYKKEYGQTFKSKDKTWRLKYGYKNLKDLEYWPDQLQQSDLSQQSDQPQQSDQALPLWIQSKDKFNELKNLIFKC